MLVVGVCPQVLFQYLVDAFGLAIALWVVTQGEMKLHLEQLAEGMEKWDTNSVPQLEVTCEGTPCFEKMWVRNS